MPSNYGLGRGLSSLIPQKKITKPEENVNYFGGGYDRRKIRLQKKDESQGDGAKERTIQEIEIFKIVPNPHQPRLKFDPEKLDELVVSIKEHGVIQPLVATKNENQYEIIAGERRFQAAKMAGLKTVPVIVREATEQQKLELAIIENIHRHDLNSIEEAKAYLKLAEEFDLSQDQIAQKAGKSRSAIANKIRLLNLPVEIQKALIESKITEGHAKAVLAVENPEKQRALFEMILKNNLTVRQAEDKTKGVSVKAHNRIVSVDPEIKELENRLVGIFGTKVRVSKSGGGGKITIDYYSKEELDGIIDKISKY